MVEDKRDITITLGVTNKYTFDFSGVVREAFNLGLVSGLFLFEVDSEEYPNLLSDLEATTNYFYNSQLSALVRVSGIPLDISLTCAHYTDRQKTINPFGDNTSLNKPNIVEVILGLSLPAYQFEQLVESFIQVQTNSENNPTVVNLSEDKTLYITQDGNMTISIPGREKINTNLNEIISLLDKRG
jgi:hypothetical protein